MLTGRATALATTALAATTILLLRHVLVGTLALALLGLLNLSLRLCDPLLKISLAVELRRPRRTRVDVVPRQLLLVPLKILLKGSNGLRHLSFTKLKFD